ncbi:restriction endonuclease subunit S [Paraburkholderia sp. SIMBA_027]|uniref:restriction endonuclease subunit S n=2 Tax=Pseudomonadati TaxID=3379134 RepID=UPI00397C992E
MKLKPYPKYKPSGVEWLGDVPSHWLVAPFKWQIERNDGGVWGNDPSDDEGTIVLRSTEQTVDGHWQIEEPAKRLLTDAERAAGLLFEGDLLVTKSSGSALHIGKTTIVDTEIAELHCCYSNFMQRIRTKRTLVPQLAWYLMNNQLARLQFDYLSNSTTGLANLNGTMIGQLLSTTPPVEEQFAIVTFLDCETTKIDTLIAKQEKLITLLQEKRQAVISHAVTKGLDPDVPIKPSGVEWLGDVPEHWGVSSLKRDIDFITSGSRGWAEHYADEGSIFIRIGNLTRDHIDLNLTDLQYVDVPTGSEGERTRVRQDDILVSITAYLGSVAVVPVGLGEAFVSQHVALARPLKRKLLPRWIAYTVLSAVGQNHFAAQGYGGTKIQLSLEDVRTIPMLTPTLMEQNAIVDYLDNEVNKIDTLITKAQQAIELQKEHRAALISAAVTGKIDVRGFFEADMGTEKAA